MYAADQYTVSNCPRRVSMLASAKKAGWALPAQFHTMSGGRPLFQAVTSSKIFGADSGEQRS